jgi:ubiquinone/menaquinone biosynthesis C-methylase UbiE
MSGQLGIAAWQLDQDSAAAYEAYLVARFFGRWAKRLVAHADITPGASVLDAGCGTGIVARTAAHAVPDIEAVGLDLNDGMLAEARRQDSHGQVAWESGSLAAMPFDDGRFDVVLSQQVLQFVPERDKALAEMYRVLIPGGRLLIALLRDISFHSSYEALAAVLDRHAGREAGDMMRSPFAGPEAATLRAELEQAGFGNVTIQHDILDVRFPSPSEYLRQEAASSPLAGPLSELAEDRMHAMMADLEAALEPFTDDPGVTFPMQTYLVQARRPGIQ